MPTTISINGLHNLRDLGDLPTIHGRTIARNQFFRSDSPHMITRHGQQQLINLGIGTIIDLRSENERNRLPNPLANHPEVLYHNIPLMADGIIEQNAEELTHLGAFYRFLLHNSQPAFAKVFSTMAEQSGAILIHCQVGKDRTGLVAALLLELAGTLPEYIIEDYVASRTNITPLLPALRMHRPEHISIQQYERLLDAHAEHMQDFLQELVRTYGSASQYLNHIGVSTFQINLLRKKLNSNAINT